MILYNVTVGIDLKAENEWLQWMKEKHIPAIMNTGLFLNYKIFKVLGHEDEPNVSYSVQYFAENINKVVKYLNEFAPGLVEDHKKKFDHVAFRTLLEEIS